MKAGVFHYLTLEQMLHLFRSEYIIYVDYQYAIACSHRGMQGSF